MCIRDSLKAYLPDVDPAEVEVHESVYYPLLKQILDENDDIEAVSYTHLYAVSVYARN